MSYGYNGTPLRRRLDVLAIVTCLVPACAAPLSAEVARDAMQSLQDQAILYKSPTGPVRHLALSGRLQAETTWFDADQGSYDDTRWRRFRFGFKGQLPGQWVVRLEGDFDLNESSNDWYSRLTEANLGWTDERSGLQLKLLKHSAGFTLDGATSSKKLLTLQRNNLTNNLWFTAEYFTGITVSGLDDGRWSYRASLFSSDDDDEIGATEASYFTVLTAGYDLSAQTGLDVAALRLDYVYNDEDEDANTRDFTHVVSLSSQWQQGALHLHTDLALGDGHLGQEDVWGLVLMPLYDFSELVQGVMRYTYLSSDGNNGLRLGRYEREIVGGRGDTYNEIYIGLNLFLDGHRLKWQTGLQYTVMDDNNNGAGDYDGWGITTGPRLYW